MRRLYLFSFILIIAAFAVFFIDRKVPAQNLPWRPLNLNAPIGIATDIQLYRVSLSPSSVCMDLITKAQDYKTKPAEPFRPDKPSQQKCGWDIAQNISGTQRIMFKPSEVDMQCPLALGSYIWLRAVNEAALEILGSDIKAVHHAGTYSCRRQRGNASGAWSEHAFANGWDVTGFELSDGSVISILKDWNGEASRRQFLRRARKDACRIFRVSLSPDFNAAHKDHFHLDMGPARSCH